MAKCKEFYELIDYVDELATCKIVKVSYRNLRRCRSYIIRRFTEGVAYLNSCSYSTASKAILNKFSLLELERANFLYTVLCLEYCTGFKSKIVFPDYIDYVTVGFSFTELYHQLVREYQEYVK